MVQDVIYSKLFIVDSAAKRYNVLVWMHKYSVAKTPHGKHQLLALRLQGDVPIPHPCGASLSPRPWGSPPSAASPRRVFLPCSVDGSCIFMHPNRVFAVESKLNLWQAVFTFKMLSASASVRQCAYSLVFNRWVLKNRSAAVRIFIYYHRGAVVQRFSMSACQAGDRGFKSRRLRHLSLFGIPVPSGAGWRLPVSVIK